MTATPGDLALYAGALLVLFLTPGPVWLALVARGLSGGFAAVWPLALGVVVGDVLWPVLAVLGLGWLLETVDAAVLLAMKLLAAAIFIWMGARVLRRSSHGLAVDERLTRPGAWSGFLAGIVVILGNPKAILFYLGVLPGFFDLTAATTADVLAIATLSMLVPLTGNLALGLVIERVRRALDSPEALRRMNRTSGVLLIAVGLVIPLT